MDLIASENLTLKEFYITNTTLLSIYPETNRKPRLDRLKINCDFDIFTAQNDADNPLNFMITFNVKCNEEEKPGYFFDIGAVGEFILSKTQEINDKTKNQYILYTALPMIINSIRVYIQQITSMHAFGTYLLPVLDLGKLLKQKEIEEDSINN